jgi:hypothetical protein
MEKNLFCQKSTVPREGQAKPGSNALTSRASFLYITNEGTIFIGISGHIYKINYLMAVHCQLPNKKGFLKRLSSVQNVSTLLRIRQLHKLF